MLLSSKLKTLIAPILLTFSLALGSCGDKTEKAVPKPETPKSSTLIQNPPQASPALGPIDLLPASSTIVATLDWKKISDSPLGPLFQSTLLPGVLPHMDSIQNISIGFNSSAQGDAEGLVAVVSGQFDPAKLLAPRNQIQGAGTEDYQGVKIYFLADAPSECVALLAGRVLSGDKDEIKKSIDLAQGRGDSIRKNEELMRRVNYYGDGKMLVLAGLWHESMGQGLEAVFPQKPRILYFDMALGSASALNANAGFTLPSPEEAEKFSGQLSELKAAAGPMLGKYDSRDPKALLLKKVTENIYIHAKGQRVELAVALDADGTSVLKKVAAGAPPSAGSSGSQARSGSGGSARTSAGSSMYAPRPYWKPYWNERPTYIPPTLPYGWTRDNRDRPRMW